MQLYSAQVCTRNCTELASKFDARNLHNFLVQVSYTSFCARMCKGYNFVKTKNASSNVDKTLQTICTELRSETESSICKISNHSVMSHMQLETEIIALQLYIIAL